MSLDPRNLAAAFAKAAGDGLEANVKRWLHFQGWQPGDYIETQALNVRGSQYAAHAPDSDTLVRLLADGEEPGVAQGIYVIANRVSTAVATRKTPSTWHLAVKGESTTDQDIKERAVLYVDVDFARPTNTSTTDAEVLQVCETVVRMYADIVSAIGHDSTAIGHSGNGCAIFIALDRLPESPELHTLIIATLRALRAIYETASIKIDASLADAKRLVPAFGTTKRKGPAGDAERPHRRTALIVPDRVRRLSYAELQQFHAGLMARMPAPPARPMLAPQVEDESEADSEQSTDENTGIELKDLRRRLVELRRNKARSIDENDRETYRLYDAILKGTALAAPGDAEVDGLPGGRAKAINKAASQIAFAVPSGLDWNVAVELLRPALAAMDCEPEGIEHWLTMAEVSYDRSMGRAVVFAKELAERRAAEEHVRQALAAAAPPPVTRTAVAEASAAEFYKLAPAGVAAAGVVPATVASTGDDDDDWTRHYIRTADMKVKACPFNVYVNFKYNPRLKGTIRFNDVSKDIVVHGGPFAGMNSATLSTAMMNWLHKVELLQVSNSEVEAQLLLIAYENIYDPIMDYLNGLVWDGQSRLDDFFFTHAKARKVSENGVDISQHLRRVSSKFLISAAARALTPGCQVDTMLVLEGVKEGEGKTEFLRRLFAPWYVVTRSNLMDKDAQMIPAENWGVEIGELSAMKKSEDDHLKSFIDTREDKYRPPYGRRYITCPRRCVFAGTTNNPQWLTPGKGKRRYWPVFIESVDLDLVSADRDQLLAEAVVRFKAGERWHFDEEERAVADAEADARLEETFVEAKISAWWHGMQPGKRPPHVTLVDVVEKALKYEQAPPAKVPQEIGFAMKHLGFTKGRPPIGGVRTAAWIPSEELLGVPAIPSYLRLVRPEDALKAAITDASAQAGE